MTARGFSLEHAPTIGSPSQKILASPETEESQAQSDRVERILTLSSWLFGRGRDGTPSSCWVSFAALGVSSLVEGSGSRTFRDQVFVCVICGKGERKRGKRRGKAEKNGRERRMVDFLSIVLLGLLYLTSRGHCVFALWPTSRCIASGCHTACTDLM